eukprot:8405614-Alexandrium_andersonii.AAC.1
MRRWAVTFYTGVVPDVRAASAHSSNACRTLPWYSRRLMRRGAKTNPRMHYRDALWKMEVRAV